MAMLRDPTAPQARPRRPSARLIASIRRTSVSLSLASSDCSRRAQAAPDEESRRSTLAWRLSLHRSSEVSNESARSNAAPAEKWFEQSNRNVGGRLGPRFVDDDPPYFLQTKSSASLNPGRDSDRLDPSASSVGWASSQFATDRPKAATSGSSADDFRSVIDDLTIENKRLKSKLRKYETSYGSHLEKDRLFEVKVHGLSPRKKRELEQTLHAFASSIHKGESTNASSSQPPHEVSLRRGVKKLSPSSASNSQHVDSAYASMSATGPKSSSTSNIVGAEKKNAPLLSHAENEKVHPSLDEVPQGLLPKHSTVMTERGKKKLVVRRLEQLFTGKLKVSGGPHPLQLQQQETSKSAARADRQVLERRGQNVSAEGIREAHILPTEMDLESGELSGGSQAEEERNSDPPGSPDQRPTRPLDLDPDRAQVPAENMEYIRHLGVSTPVMAVEDLIDITAKDAHGWMYLNLLVNMAQLHIINVTPDFVRSAVIDFSTHFQLSPDGRKIRWRGGTEGTELSSDSGADSNGVPLGPSSDSDIHEEHNQKRRKIDNGSSQIPTGNQDLKHGRYSAAPITASSKDQPARNKERLNALKYKPLFAHQSIADDDEMSLDDSASNPLSTMADESAAGRMSSARKEAGWRSHSGSSSKRKRNEGTMIFYTDAPFCTDLAGDTDSISPPLHVEDVGADGFSNHTDDAIGCKPQPLVWPAPPPTPSDSTTPFGPFKRCSLGAKPVLEADCGSQTPELSDGASGNLDFSPQWMATGPQPDIPPLSLEASGLGGTQPADHFTVRVETKRTILDDTERAKLVKLPPRKPITYKILHDISRSSLDSLPTPDRYENDTSYPSLIHESPSPADLLLKTEIISVQVQYLEPSNLPPPAAYRGPSSSSTEWPDDASSDNDKGVIPPIQQHPGLVCPSFSPPSEDYQAECNEDLDSSSMDEGETSSIDMLAYARERDPDTVAAREQEFEREAAGIVPAAVPMGIAATTTDDSSEMADSRMSGD